MLGASAGWALPYSYQCNLMVMAAGKYKTADFIKIGLPYHVSVVLCVDATCRGVCKAVDEPKEPPRVQHVALRSAAA